MRHCLCSFVRLNKLRIVKIRTNCHEERICCFLFSSGSLSKTRLLGHSIAFIFQTMRSIFMMGLFADQRMECRLVMEVCFTGVIWVYWLGVELSVRQHASYLRWVSLVQHCCHIIPVWNNIRFHFNICYIQIIRAFSDWFCVPSCWIVYQYLQTNVDIFCVNKYAWLIHTPSIVVVQFLFDFDLCIFDLVI